MRNKKVRTTIVILVFVLIIIFYMNEKYGLLTKTSLLPESLIQKDVGTGTNAFTCQHDVCVVYGSDTCTNTNSNPLAREVIYRTNADMIRDQPFQSTTVWAWVDTDNDKKADTCYAASSSALQSAMWCANNSHWQYLGYDALGNKIGLYNGAFANCVGRVYILGKADNTVCDTTLLPKSPYSENKQEVYFEHESVSSSTCLREFFINGVIKESVKCDLVLGSCKLITQKHSANIGDKISFQGNIFFTGYNKECTQNSTLKCNPPSDPNRVALSCGRHLGLSANTVYRCKKVSSECYEWAVSSVCPDNMECGIHSSTGCELPPQKITQDEALKVCQDAISKGFVCPTSCYKGIRSFNGRCDATSGMALCAYDTLICPNGCADQTKPENVGKCIESVGDACNGVDCDMICESGVSKYNGYCDSSSGKAVCKYASERACEQGCYENVCKETYDKLFCAQQKTVCNNYCEGNNLKHDGRCVVDSGTTKCVYEENECVFGCGNNVCLGNPCLGIKTEGYCDAKTGNKYYNGKCFPVTSSGTLAVVNTVEASSYRLVYDVESCKGGCDDNLVGCREYGDGSGSGSEGDDTASLLGFIKKIVSLIISWFKSLW